MRINKDNVINAICIFGIVITICFMIIVLLKFFYFQKIDISFIKDIFSIGATLGAALIAISLFSDWKEQHNKTILAPEAIAIYKNLEQDIMDIAKHNLNVKKHIDELILSASGQEVFTSLEEINVKNKIRIVELKYFSTLSKNIDMDSKIVDFFNKISGYQNYMIPLFEEPSGRRITQELVDKTGVFTVQTIKEINQLKSLLSDYIILK